MYLLALAEIRLKSRITDQHLKLKSQEYKALPTENEQLCRELAIGLSQASLA